MYATFFFATVLLLAEGVWMDLPERGLQESVKNLTEAGASVIGREGCCRVEIADPRTQPRGNGVLRDPEELESTLRGLAERHPRLATLRSLGKSAEGRDIWCLALSDAEKGRFEPAVRFVANIHGDETAGRHVVTEFARYLLETYDLPGGEERDRVRRLLDETEIHLVPSLNPDGFARGTRWNANSKDLNRDFPDRWLDPEDSTEGREPETRAVMEWTERGRFALSASYHGGAAVAVYPWDSASSRAWDWTYAATPVDALYRSLAKDYAARNTAMRENYHFRDGTTNGADWYALYGGMQDWGFLKRGVLEVTLEIGQKKTVDSEGELRQAWQQNREAMLSFAEAALGPGFYGLVLEAGTGVPVGNATVELDGNGWRVYARADGAYFRPALPGPHVVCAGNARTCVDAIAATGGRTRLDVRV